VPLTEKGYRHRLVDTVITRYLRLFGALSIEGPKWCGKTWTALNHANSAVYILDPENDYANREAARLNPSSVLDGKKPLLVDEWQEVPGIWDAVRFLTDRTKQKGLYLLTGSVTPKEKSYVHSGAGRIARVRMRTMSLYESGVSRGSVSLQGLFNQEAIQPGTSKLDQDTLINLIIRGGWPESLEVSNEDAAILPRQYLDVLSETDISHVDNVRRNPELVLQVVSALARITATTASNNRIVADVQGRYGDVTRQTVAEYLTALKRLYVIDEIPQWFPDLRDRLRLRKTPKRMLADPSLAVSALHAQASDLKRDPRTLGALFESLCLRDMLVYAESSGSKLSHYHDSTDLEVDIILERGNKWAALEIKLGSHRVEEGAKALKRLAAKLTGKGATKPDFLAVITGGGPLYTREDDIHVIPIDSLRD
jgi:predicted AAA+ superfamily ATPase